MAKTDDTRTFGGKKYRYLCWVKNKSSVDWFKRKAKADGQLIRVTPQPVQGFPSSGYNIWVRPQGR